MCFVLQGLLGSKHPVSTGDIQSESCRWAGLPGSFSCLQFHYVLVANLHLVGEGEKEVAEAHAIIPLLVRCAEERLEWMTLGKLSSLPGILLYLLNLSGIIARSWTGKRRSIDDCLEWVEGGWLALQEMSISKCLGVCNLHRTAGKVQVVSQREQRNSIFKQKCVHKLNPPNPVNTT